MTNDFPAICPEVDQRWQDSGEIGLDWLEQHAPTCPKCQLIIRLISQVVVPELMEILGDDPKNYLAQGENDVRPQ